MTLQITHAIPVYAPAWQYGGPVLSVSRLCKALQATSNHVNVITTNAGIEPGQIRVLNEPFNYDGVDVTYFSVDQNKSHIWSKSLIAALPESLSNSNIIHLSAIWQPIGIPIQNAAFKMGIPVLHSLRGALGPYSFGQHWWKKVPYYWLREKPWLNKVAGLHVTTSQEADEVRRLKLNIPIYQLPNPIALDYLVPDELSGLEWRSKLQLNPDTPLLLICGRQHHKKGLDLLPPVLSELRHMAWHLVIVGNDDDGSGIALIRELQKLKLHGRITSIPSQPATEITQIYNAVDLLLLPSRHENFGNVVIEALACGCAIMVSDQTGVGNDLLKMAPKGFGAVLPREEKAWAAWLGSWLQHPCRASKHSTFWVSQHYSSTAVAKQAIAIYEDIVLGCRP